MAKSSKRAKKPAALSGIPQKVIDLSPREWPPERRAKWCRAFLAGAAKPWEISPPANMREFVLAYRQGCQSASTLTTELAQVKDTAKAKQKRTLRRQEQRDRALDADRLSLLNRLDNLDRLNGSYGLGDPHDDASIVMMASLALGVGKNLHVPRKHNPEGNGQ